VQTSIVKNAVRSARRSVLTAYVATAALVAALVIERFAFESVFEQAVESSQLAAQLSATILLEDERLTMSASMAASTGERRWADRYEQRIGPMDEAIAKGSALASKEVAARFENETKAANDALVEIEREALAAAGEGRNAAAQALLDSEVYQHQKRVLAEGTDRFLKSLQDAGLARMDATQQRATFMVAGLLAAAGLGFLLLWRRLDHSLATSEEGYLHAERRLVLLALHDELTGLPNRRAFAERLEQMAADAVKEARPLAVALLDIDNFKDVNDTHGHQTGDELIRQIARRLRDVLPEGAIVARLGGDEFAIAAPGFDDAGARALIRRSADLFLQPFEIAGQSLHVTLSAGIAFAPQHADQAVELQRLADLALYRAKADGRARAKIFNSGMDESRRERLAIEADLRTAIAAGQMALHYQPLMSGDGSRITGVEALMRWTHPARGPVPPTVFISIAEQSNLIISLGEWLMRRAFSDAQSWQSLTTAVNLSPRQFQQPEFVATVRRLVKETGVDPQTIELEITESVLLEESERVKRALQDLRDMGFRIALDDFGIGYSSLSYLRRFPFHKIKIDRSFINSIGASQEAAQIIHSMVGLGRALGMTVTAEGVETTEQHRFLQAAGCQQLQGFLFGKAMPAADLQAWVRRLDDRQKKRA
jgi:diguanylate cyclase (GGDEF)-like protein